MMMSFSPPGLPSPFSLRTPLASCGEELCANPDAGNTAAVMPKAESTEANRCANILRVKLRFIYVPLSVKSANGEKAPPLRCELYGTKQPEHLVEKSGSRK